MNRFGVLTPPKYERYRIEWRTSQVVSEADKRMACMCEELRLSPGTTDVFSEHEVWWAWQVVEDGLRREQRSDLDLLLMSDEDREADRLRESSRQGIWERIEWYLNFPGGRPQNGSIGQVRAQVEQVLREAPCCLVEGFEPSPAQPIPLESDDGEKAVPASLADVFSGFDAAKFLRQRLEEEERQEREGKWHVVSQWRLDELRRAQDAASLRKLDEPSAPSAHEGRAADRREEVRRLYNEENYTQEQIGAHFGVRRETVNRWLNKM